ncbi:ATP synthase gamma chain [Candidatus Ecksteinia adelgidicola]|nr:ATP synthase gamma chain [Candidatus Ecksteinia adelgidicola]
MPNSKEIHSKIGIVKNAQKITKAMEMIATFKMKKSKEHMIAGRHYIKFISKVISNIVSRNQQYMNPYLKKRNIYHVGYLVISTDHGLCGCLNINLFKKILIEIEYWSQKNVKVHLALIGAKAVSFFSSINNHIIEQITHIGDKPSLLSISKLITVMLKAYNDHRIDKLYVSSNKFISSLVQKPCIVQLLPLLNINCQELKKTPWDYIYEPNSKIILDIVIHRYLKSNIYQNIVENIASEQAARMVAMKAATDNGSHLIKDLKLVYNKTRQTNITQEITEIITGTSIV